MTLVRILLALVGVAGLAFGCAGLDKYLHAGHRPPGDVSVSNLIYYDLEVRLAGACHQDCLAEQFDAGSEPGTAPTLVPWEELAPRYRADDATRRHPALVAWSALPEPEREKEPAPRASARDRPGGAARNRA